LQSSVTNDQHPIRAGGEQYPQVLVAGLRRGRCRHGRKHNPVLGRFYDSDVELLRHPPMGFAQ